MTDELRSYGEGTIKSLIDDEFAENADKSDNDNDDVDTVKDKRTIKVHFSTIRRILTHEVVTRSIVALFL
ncbi:hypothetical protein TSAR_011035 [Trichomalopsis sarcophagae]|uniref:Uncharacterized protein n=1 Tax=Trichomalopsis sarcophagae TaxID=543379 RepID=A0A232EFZ2_9HYME|nr:hypothetical protein TSAR_011035 [Trichomalopsis sarcophagae]